MSVNITIAVPLDAITAVTQNTDPTKMADALATITKAAVEGVKSLPYRMEPAAVKDEEDNLSIKSFDSNEPAFAPRPAKKQKRDHAQHLLPRETQIFLRDLKGGTLTFEVNLRMKVEYFRSLVEDRTRVAADRQRLIFAGRQLEDRRTLADFGVIKEATLYLVLRLTES